MKQIPAYATKLFACGNAAGNWMFQGQPFQILNNAIDTKKHTYSEQVAAEVRKEFDIENCKVIGHIGRFNPQKNHTFLIDIEIYTFPTV